MSLIWSQVSVKYDKIPVLKFQYNAGWEKKATITLQVAWDKHCAIREEQRVGTEHYSPVHGTFSNWCYTTRKKKVVLLEHWKGVEKAQKYYLHFFFQTFPHSPCKLNRTPTKSFAVTAKVNPLSNFSDCPGSLHCKRKIKFYASDYEHHTSQSKHGQPGLRLSGTENVQQL